MQAAYFPPGTHANRNTRTSRGMVRLLKDRSKRAGLHVQMRSKALSGTGVEDALGRALRARVGAPAARVACHVAASDDGRCAGAIHAAAHTLPPCDLTGWIHGSCSYTTVSAICRKNGSCKAEPVKNNFLLCGPSGCDVRALMVFESCFDAYSTLCAQNACPFVD